MAKQAFDPNRPTRPDRDPLLDEVVTLLKQDTRSRFAKANVSGLSVATLKNWEERKVRRPQSVSIQMAAAALGYQLALVRK